MPGTLVWFQRDLRLTDNPALASAARRGEPVIPVYIASPYAGEAFAIGEASRWWLHNSLEALDTALRERGSRLTLKQGDPRVLLPALVRETDATAVHWNRLYEPGAAAAMHAVHEALRASGIEAQSHNAALLVEPAEMLNHAGKPYQVFTPFRRRVLEELDPPAPLPAPRRLPTPSRWPASEALEASGLLPRPAWWRKLAAHWQPGESGARKRLSRFLREGLTSYATARDRPDLDGTSRLSPHLHHGEIGPRQIWHALGARGRNSKFLSELVWREFAYHLLHHFPHTPHAPLRPEFADFEWRRDERILAAWQAGQTGIPLVDAGMRQLWASGWMHNRVRMIVASFLVKNLLQPWQDGARWFWDTLVDADLANNTLGWQWVAGSGADAAPYFRIFNPVVQGQRFDPEGDYVRRWVPELRGIAGRAVHTPWLHTRASSGDYPPPIVDLRRSREAALAAYERLRGRTGE